MGSDGPPRPLTPPRLTPSGIFTSRRRAVPQVCPRARRALYRLTQASRVSGWPWGAGGRGAHTPRGSRLDPASGRHRSPASHPDWWEPHLVCSLEEVQRPLLEPFFWNTNNSHFRNFSLKGKSNNTTFPTFLHFLSLTLVIYL